MQLEKKFKTEFLPCSEDGIDRAAKFLSDGQLVAFPTETVYGLGADATSKTATAKVFAAKKRPIYNPLIIHLLNTASLEEWVQIPKQAEGMIANLWPGPLTLVLPKNRKNHSRLSTIAIADLDTVAVRIPSHPIAQKLLKKFAGPIAAPSANISGELSPTRAEDVYSKMKGKIAGILDGGKCMVGLESTIVKVTKDTVHLLRPGGIPLEEIQRYLNDQINIAYTNEVSTNKISSPGQLKSHYAPKSSLRLNADSPLENELFLGYGEMPANSKGLCLSKSSNLNEAGQNLFAALADLDKMAEFMGLKNIAVAPIPNHSIGIAINDRLKRATLKKD